jgi:hypothetical protein
VGGEDTGGSSGQEGSPAEVEGSESATWQLSSVNLRLWLPWCPCKPFKPPAMRENITLLDLKRFQLIKRGWRKRKLVFAPHPLSQHHFLLLHISALIYAVLVAVILVTLSQLSLILSVCFLVVSKVDFGTPMIFAMSICVHYVHTSLHLICHQG